MGTCSGDCKCHLCAHYFAISHSKGETSRHPQKPCPRSPDHSHALTHARTRALRVPMQCPCVCPACARLQAHGRGRGQAETTSGAGGGEPSCCWETDRRRPRERRNLLAATLRSRRPPRRLPGPSLPAARRAVAAPVAKTTLI